VIGAMLDLIIRDATNGNKSIDNVMKKMFYKYSKNGFYSKNIEQAVTEVCNCNIHSFFESYVYNASPMDFNRYLKLIGKQVNITWKLRTDENGKPLPDWQVNVYRPVNDTGFNILIYDPESCWAKAGLHTNDKVVAVNDMPITNTQIFRDMQRKFEVGDTVTFAVKRNSTIKIILVPVTGYNVPVAQITSLKNISIKQQKIFSDWNELN